MSTGEKRRRSSSGVDNPASKIRAIDDSPSKQETDTEVSSEEDLRYQDLYTKPVDFKALAQQEPDLAPFVKGRDLDFNDPSAVQQLTKSLLKRDFNLELELPDDRLCPPVPNRHNYILFLKSLIDTSLPSTSSTRKITGLDIGTGSSCIYPVLGTTQRGWSFYATDIDEKNLDYAARNIKANHLEKRITLLPRKPEDALIPEFEDPITFLMTNPPFYSSQAELEASAEAKTYAPSSICTGAPVEMVTEGGEVAFVSRILTESLSRKEDVQWYTAMLGFLSSLTTMIEKIKKEGITNWAVHELTQGNKTRRWVLAWSFSGMRPAEHVCRGVNNKVMSLPPPTLATIWSLPLPCDTSALSTGLGEAISKLDLLSWSWDQSSQTGTGRAPGNVWNRSWRRKKKALETQGQPMTHSERDVFGFKVEIILGMERVEVQCRWLEGHDFVTFESFQGFLKAALKSLSPK